MRRLTLTVTSEQAGKEVGALLRRELHLSAASLRRAKGMPQGILLDGAEVFTNVRVTPGQTLSVAVGDSQGSEGIAPVPGPLELCYEDEDLVVVNKAGGVPVHPSQGHHGDTLANFLLHHYQATGQTAAFHPVNRLDRGTSGLMAVAKHPHAHERLQVQLGQGGLSRTYLAVCQGRLPQKEGTVEAPIARLPGSVLQRTVSPQGAFARTRYRVVKEGNGRSLVALGLDTGRTHQIRVHMAFLKHPLVGDFLYGQETEELPGRFALHSHTLTLTQPVTGKRLSFLAPLPWELLALLTPNTAERRHFHGEPPRPF